jgi:large subunit ribosomal protein L3
MNAVALMGKKLRMTQKFDDKGNVVACTVIEAEPNVIAQIKNQEKDGYNALQLGFKKVAGKTDDRKKKRIKKARFGHFAKNKIEPRYHLAECRVESVEGYDLGQEITISQFENISFVDVTGKSKGKVFFQISLNRLLCTFKLNGFINQSRFYIFSIDRLCMKSLFH